MVISHEIFPVKAAQKAPILMEGIVWVLVTVLQTGKKFARLTKLLFKVLVFAAEHITHYCEKIKERPFERPFELLFIGKKKPFQSNGNHIEPTRGNSIEIKL